MAAATLTMHLPRTRRTRTGGNFPINMELAWVTLMFVLLCGAALDGACQALDPVNFIESTYGMVSLDTLR